MSDYDEFENDDVETGCCMLLIRFEHLSDRMTSADEL